LLHHIQPDHLGTPRKVIQTSNNTAIWNWPILGNAFGEAAPTGAITLNLRFPGQYFDAETGLNYNYFRDYEPGTGRYVESDPIGLAAGVSTYGYALQNPLLLFDPNGLRSWYCQRPLCPAGTNCTTGERGPPVTNHQYLCATRWDGSIECGGQSSDKPTDFTSPGRPTRPDEDAYNPNSCDQVDDDKDRCLERCLLTNFKKPRPTYGIGPQATDCQEWADDTLWGCQVHCRNPKNARKFLDL